MRCRARVVPGLVAGLAFLAGCTGGEKKEGAVPPPSTASSAPRPSEEEKDPLARADRLHSQGNLEAAIGELERALRDDPDNARARYFYANYLIEKGELRGAATELTRTLDLRSRDVPAPIAWLRLGEVREAQGEHRAALEAYLKAIEAEREAEQRLLRDPKKAAAVTPPEYAGVPRGSPEPYRNVARVSIFLGDLDGALQAIEHARVRAPRDPFTEDLAVRAYQRLGDEARVVEAARRFVELAGGEPIFSHRVAELREIVRQASAPLTAVERSTLVDYVRTALRPRLPGDAPEERFFGEHPVPRLLANDDRAVFVTVVPDELHGARRGATGAPTAPRLRGRGRGKSLAAALAGAVKAIQDDPRFNPVALDRTAVRIDVEKGGLEHVELSPSEYAPLDEPVVLSYAARPEIEPGVHGLALRAEDREVYCLPGDAVSEDLPDVKAMLEFACRSAGLSARAWEGAASRVFRFRTESFVSPAPGAAPVELVRGEALPFPEATAGSCRDGATLGALWLASALVLEEKPSAEPIRERLPDGSIALVHTRTLGLFHYGYRARSDRWDDGSYSEVRHAGAALALVNAFARTGRLELRDAAELAARWLEDHVQAEGDRAVVVVEGKAKLGTQALTLCLEDELARTAPGSPDGGQDAGRAALRDGLARTIVAAMREDGTFPAAVPARGTVVPRDNESQFFPGEAILALVRHFKVTGERRWLDAALKGADARIREWQARGARPPAGEGAPPLDAWLARALGELDELEVLATDARQAERRAFALEIARTIVAHQAGEERGDAAGGLSAPGETFPRGMPTASLGEGLASVADLARRRGLPEAQALRDASRRAASFVLRHQYTSRNAWYLANPERARGAFRSVLTGSRVRIDGVQHSLELLLLVERLLES